MVQWVTKPPKKRFRTSKSPPDTPRPAQSQPKNGLFSPLWLLWRHIVVKPVIAVKIRRIKIFPVNQYEMTLAHRFVFLGKAGARRRPQKKTARVLFPIGAHGRLFYCGNLLAQLPLFGFFLVFFGFFLFFCIFGCFFLFFFF